MSTNRRTFLTGAGAAGATAYVSKFGIGRARAQEPIRIGGQGALSGAHADYGRQIRMGATLAIEEINANGGILGRQVELNFADEELRPDVAVRNARQQVSDWGADFLVGVDSSGSSLAIGPVLAELDRICIFTHAATHRLTEELCYDQGIRQIFRASVPVYQDAILAARMFAEREDITRWANIGADYEYGYASWAMFKHTLQEAAPRRGVRGRNLGAVPDPRLQRPRVLGHGGRAQRAVLDPVGRRGGRLLRTGLVMGAFDQTRGLVAGHGGLGRCAGRGCRPARPVPGQALGHRALPVHLERRGHAPQRNDQFVANFQERWGRFPNYSAECTYAAVYSIKEGCEAADSTETSAVIEALEGMTVETPAGMRTYREEDHQAVYTVPGGRVVKLDEYPIPVVGADLTISRRKNTTAGRPSSRSSTDKPCHVAADPNDAAAGRLSLASWRVIPTGSPPAERR
jgi:branched-chain amino acid transport system substrate-binding protein